jgi:hypothetical protein
MMRIERVVEVEDPVGDVLEIDFIRRAVDLGHGGLMARLLWETKGFWLPAQPDIGFRKNAVRFSQL